MGEELTLVRDLAVILISAGIFTILSRVLKQPLVLGYIIAGILIGPNVKFFFGISSAEAVHQWSEIGIIFMMFGLGLEFSFKKFLKVGSGALVTAGFKALGVFVMGFVTGQAMSWSVMESIFLGGLLSMSSTAVVLKSYDDMGLKDRPWAPMVFGTLVVEDLIAILLMVLLSTMAVSNKFAGGELLVNLGKLIFFLVLWFLVGIYLIPSILKKVRRYLGDEILLIVSIGLCFGMVTLAQAAGYSSALGAFMMGSIFAETIESEHIEKLVRPIKDLFAAVFFVSVGMMVAPSVIAQNYLVIIILTLIVIITHIVFSAVGIIVTGGGLRNAVHTGFSLAQLGEFGFIIAGVGCTLGVMRDFIYPVVIAVSVVTTFTTPYMIRLAGPVCSLLERKLPAALLEKLTPSVEPKRSAAEKNLWKDLLVAYFVRIAMYGVALFAVDLGSRLYLEPLLERLFPSWSPFLHNLVLVAITIAVMLPFLYGMGVSSGSINSYSSRLVKEKEKNLWPVIGLVLARSLLVVSIVVGVISSRFSLAGWTVVLIFIAGIAVILMARHSTKRYSAIEKHFLSNLNEKESLERRKAPVTASIRDKMAGYDVHIEVVEVSPDSSFVGEKMKDIPFRSGSGANIARIKRGSGIIDIPGGDTVIYPYDQLVAVGTSAQLKALKALVSGSVHVAEDASGQEFEVVPITLGEDSYLSGKVLRSLSMRDYGCMVISVLRGNEFITNPGPDFRFAPNDTVWIAGETSSCEWLAG